MTETSQNDLLLAKLEDKIKFCHTRNKITYTDFLTEPELLHVEKYLHLKKIGNYFLFGGYENASRKMVFFYPSKLTCEQAFSNVNQVLKIIRITLPNHTEEPFEHRTYLSAIMKLGIVREKFGDIVVYPEGADIIVQKENSSYFQEHLQELIRFRKASLTILDISQIHEDCQRTEEISIIVNDTMRIDNFVSELCHCSRNKSEEILLQERVLLNYETVTRNAKTIKMGDILTIRGLGKFTVKEISRKTRSGKNVVILEHPTS